MVIWTLSYMFFGTHIYAFLLGIYLRVKSLGNRIYINLTLGDNAKLFLNWLHNFTFPSALKEFPLFHIVTNTLYWQSLILPFYNSSCILVSHQGFYLHFSYFERSWLSFHLCIGHYISSFEQFLFMSLAHFSTELFFLVTFFFFF